MMINAINFTYSLLIEIVKIHPIPNTHTTISKYPEKNRILRT